MNSTEAHAWATKILVQLTKPLHPVYANANEFLYDFWPDLPWNQRDATSVARAILSNENLRFVVRAFDVRHGLADTPESVEVGLMCEACGNMVETPLSETEVFGVAGA